MATFSSETGGIVFYYPAGWQVIATDRLPSRFLENYAVQPRGQDFQGRRGQVVIRVCDPMFVMEEARARFGVGSDILFERFINTLPGEQGVRAGRRTYNGVQYHYAISYTQEMETHYAGVVSSSGYPNFAGMAVGPGGASASLPLLFQITSSMSSPWPGRALDGPATAVRNWYRALSGGNARALWPLACSQAAQGMVLMSFADPSVGDFMVRAARGFDFSGLRFQTVASGPNAAVVRIGGNVVAPNGSVTPLYQSASLMRGSNSLVVRAEGGTWRVCGPARGGYR